MDPLRIQAGELTAQEILDALQEGRRIVVRADLFGAEREMTLRHDGDTFYCDTPTRLHKHDEEAEMRSCIERMGYGRDDDEDDAEE
jgi:hemin uptake protein HemP